MEALTGNLRPERQGGQRQNVADDLTLDLVPAVACDARNREGRIGRQAFLDKLRFGQGQFVVRRLQAPIVEERDLNGRVHRQGSTKKSLNGAPRPLCVIDRANGHHVFIDGLAGNCGHNTHASVGRKRRAAGKHECAKKSR